MTKQSKVDDLKQLVESAMVPLITSDSDQAPVIPFVPYANYEHSEPYSPLLLEKANALAAKIWTDQEGYMAYKAPYAVGKTREELAVIDRNKAFFDYNVVNAMIRRLFTIHLLNADQNSLGDNFRITELIKKLKRLEKKYDRDDIIDELTREQLIDNILMPAHLYGVDGGYISSTVQFRYPMQKSVVTELLTMEDMLTIESIIAYIPKIRELLASSKLHMYPQVKKKRLMANWMIDPKSYSSNKDCARFLSDLLNFASFFNCVLPYELRADMIPALRYPTAVSQHHDELREASTALRNEALTYVQKQKSLSSLLQATVDVSNALHRYFSSVAVELEGCFTFINRTGIKFEKLVEESKQRIDSSGDPF